MTVPFSQFADLQIVIGTIVEVTVVPEADRLLRLLVDVGEAEPRQIISGIRDYVAELDSLVGTQCPFVINLEPRTIRGYESNGMILAAHHENNFSFLIPQQMGVLPPGTPIR